MKPLKQLSFCLALFASQAWSYPTFFIKGYRSCLSCHANPDGSGILTSYGQAIAGSESFIGRSTQDADEAPWELKLNSDRLKIAAQARLMAAQAGEGEVAVFPMQADILAQNNFTEKHRLEAVLGYQSTKGQGSKSWSDHAILRRLVYGYRPNDQIDFSFGRSLKPSPLLTDDHTAYERSETRQGVLDTVTLARITVSSEHSDLSIFAAAPGFQEERSNREYGGGTRYEYQWAPWGSAGLYVFGGRSPSITREWASIFTRIALNHRVGLLASIDRIERQLHSDKSTARFGENVATVRPFFEPATGLQVAFVAENAAVQQPFENSKFRWGPRIDMRLYGHFSLIGLYQIENQGGQRLNTWSVQLFGYL